METVTYDWEGPNGSTGSFEVDGRKFNIDNVKQQFDKKPDGKYFATHLIKGRVETKLEIHVSANTVVFVKNLFGNLRNFY